MKIIYDPETDSLTITLRQERIKESDEVRPGVIADFGYDGGLVRLEILQASKVVQNTREIQFAINVWHVGRALPAISFNLRTQVRRRALPALHAGNDICQTNRNQSMAWRFLL